MTSRGVSHDATSSSLRNSMDSRARSRSRTVLRESPSGEGGAGGAREESTAFGSYAWS